MISSSLEVSGSLHNEMSPVNFSTGGPSGCSVAARLAQSSSKPSVLLLEAGGDNKDLSYLIPADRFTLFGKEPSLNWGYKTEPQTQLKGKSCL